MAEAFLGLEMLVTLLSPPDAQLQGKVSSIIAGQSLTLRDVYCPGNGQSITEITIRASDIKDLVEAPKENIRLPLAQFSAPQVVRQNFEDPAILSMGKRPTISIPIPVAHPVSVQTPIVHEELRRSSASTLAALDHQKTTTIATGAGEITIPVEEDHSDADIQQVQSKKPRPRKRRGRGGKHGDTQDLDPLVPQVDETNPSKGWRQTPMLAPNPSFQPFATLKKKTKGKTYDNGWATEDATDVQEMGEFDFESNLSKFDKRTVFEGIRAEDVTADEDRLVGHNRVARPGTNGGKNLHPLENVLDGMNINGKAAWNSEADDSEAVIGAVKGSQRDTGSGRTSRRGDSKLRKAPSRKESGAFESTTVRTLPSVQSGAPGSFFTISSNKRCDVVSHLNMLNLENIADSEYGLSEDMMSENCGRGLSELALSLVSGRGRSLGRDTTGSAPYAVVLAGNNKSGLRSVAASRHLRNHGLNVVVCVLGLERESELLAGLRRQLKVFRTFGGKIFSKIELMDYAKTMSAAPVLIIDGLFGLTMAFEELRTGDQAAAFELIEWANRSEAEVMAIDIPTGIDPSTGKTSIIDGRPLYIRPAFVICMAAPKKGLLQAMSLGEGVNGLDSWRLWIVDIGIASLAWKKAGTRMRNGVHFEHGWTEEITFKAGVE